MSIEALTVVLNHSNARGTEKLVLIGIANHHGENGAWPSVATLARYANLTERRVQQVIKTLEMSGELIVERGKGGGSGTYKTNRYWIPLSCPQDCSGSPSHSRVKPASFSSEGVKPASLKGEADFVQGVKPAMTKPLIETVKEPSLKGWEEFWDLYPRTESKAEALKAYEKALKKNSAEYLLERLNLYIAHNKKHDIKFAYAATWLNKERYLDEYDQVAKAQQNDREKINREREQREKEYEQMRLNSAPPPKCKHEKTLALCPICVKEL